MKKMLYKGTNIIVDRYSYSGIAFSAAKPVCQGTLYAFLGTPNTCYFFLYRIWISNGANVQTVVC